MPVNGHRVRNVCVYCASSRNCGGAYLGAAATLGRALARAGIGVVYGGGEGGLMGCVANAALAEGGRVVGILPRFMDDLEWGHPRLTELVLVDNMHDRKRAMLERSDAVVALPGGCGTLEELFEAMAWKRLGLYFGPIVLVNVEGFFDPCLELLDRCVAEKFMDCRHRAMWSVVKDPGAVIDALLSAAEWPADCRSFAVPGVLK